jgi:hypothetical protein
LQETIYETEVLERHIKGENASLKKTIVKLDKKTKGFEDEKKCLIKEAEKWYGKTQEAKEVV